MHASAQRVVNAAAEAGLVIEPLEYPDGTRTAEDAAEAVGCTVDQITKSMIFSADGGLVLALTSGAHRVDGAKLAELIGVADCGRADADAVRETTGYAIGGVPPFGHANEIQSVIDPHLLSFDIIWAAAGTPRHVFPLAPADLVRLTGAIVGDFTS